MDDIAHDVRERLSRHIRAADPDGDYDSAVTWSLTEAMEGGCAVAWSLMVSCPSPDTSRMPIAALSDPVYAFSVPTDGQLANFAETAVRKLNRARMIVASGLN